MTPAQDRVREGWGGLRGADREAEDGVSPTGPREVRERLWPSGSGQLQGQGLGGMPGSLHGLEGWVACPGFPSQSVPPWGSTPRYLTSQVYSLAVGASWKGPILPSPPPLPQNVPSEGRGRNSSSGEVMVARWRGTTGMKGTGGCFPSPKGPAWHTQRPRACMSSPRPQSPGLSDGLITAPASLEPWGGVREGVHTRHREQGPPLCIGNTSCPSEGER